MFAAVILAGCRDLGIHTAIETCGACKWQDLERLVDLSDLVLYDLKLIDQDLHRRWTGVSNRHILANARRLAAYNVQVRVPLIPGITDTERNLRDIFGFMCDAGLSRVALLPYNPSSGAKYEWLGRVYGLQGMPQDEEVLAGYVRMARGMGLEAAIG